MCNKSNWLKVAYSLILEANMGNWLKPRTLTTGKFSFNAVEDTFQLQYMKYYSGILHFSHATQNVVDVSRVSQ